MGLLGQLFGAKKGIREEISVVEADMNPSYEHQLKKDFGLDYRSDGWGFEGGKIVDEMVSQWSKPEICLGTLKLLQKEGLLNKVCIVSSNKMVVLVCNTKPSPTCFVSGLDTSGVGNLIALSIKGGAKTFAYRGTWMLTL